jgi:hypothetical protein
MRPGRRQEAQALPGCFLERQRLLAIFLADEDMYEIFAGGNRHEDLASDTKRRVVVMRLFRDRLE